MEEMNQIVVFKLGNESYGVPISNVKEIINVMQISSLPATPKYIEGIINIRGNIHVIFNLREKFVMEEKPLTSNSKIILVNGKKIGFIVDEVSEILHIENQDYETTLGMPVELRKNYIEGIAKVNGNIIAVLNLGNILSIKDENEVEKIIH